MKKIVLITLVALAGCSTLHETHGAKVYHVVLCWLKDAGNATHRSRIMEAAESFREIPGVLDVRAGEALASDRSIVDDSFDVAIVLSFADTQSLNEYLAHPVHEKTKEEVLLPIVQKIVVYDFQKTHAP